MGPAEAVPAAGQERPRRRRRSLAVLTHNVLAPCYKRLRGKPRKWGGLGGRPREADLDEVWVARQREVAAAVAAVRPLPDVVCLQEYWTDERCAAVYEEVLGGLYETHVKRRPRKSDAVACLVRRGAGIRVEAVSRMEAPYAGQRVAIAVHLRVAGDAGPDAAGAAASVIVCNMHLQYPSCRHDDRARALQAKYFADETSRFRKACGLDGSVPCLLLGDMNGSGNGDQVYEHLLERSYRSCHADVHGAEPGATHRCHRGREFCADVVFLRQGAADARQDRPQLRTTGAELLPRGLPHDSFPDERDYATSDHRPLLVTFDVEECA